MSDKIYYVKLSNKQKHEMANNRLSVSGMGIAEDSPLFLRK